MRFVGGPGLLALAGGVLTLKNITDMPQFNSYQDALDAMKPDDPTDLLAGRPPGNLTKREQKNWSGSSGCRFECGCTILPGSREGLYSLTVGPRCTDQRHGSIKGNVS